VKASRPVLEAGGEGRLSSPSQLLVGGFTWRVAQTLSREGAARLFLCSLHLYYTFLWMYLSRYIWSFIHRYL